MHAEQCFEQRTASLRSTFGQLRLDAGCVLWSSDDRQGLPRGGDDRLVLVVERVCDRVASARITHAAQRADRRRANDRDLGAAQTHQERNRFGIAGLTEQLDRGRGLRVLAEVSHQVRRGAQSGSRQRGLRCSSEVGAPQPLDQHSQSFGSTDGEDRHRDAVDLRVARRVERLDQSVERVGMCPPSQRGGDRRTHARCALGLQCLEQCEPSLARVPDLGERSRRGLPRRLRLRSKQLGLVSPLPDAGSKPLRPSRRARAVRLPARRRARREGRPAASEASRGRYHVGAGRSRPLTRSPHLRHRAGKYRVQGGKRQTKTLRSSRWWNDWKRSCISSRRVTFLWGSRWRSSKKGSDWHVTARVAWTKRSGGSKSF